jgi:hypothetical protein
VSLDTTALQASLTTYSTYRLAATNEDIAFLQGFFRLSSKQETVDFVLERLVPELNPVPRPSVTIFDRLAVGVTDMGMIGTPIELFNHFSSIERDFRPIELAIFEGRSRVEAGIQMQVDLSLGK